MSAVDWGAVFGKESREPVTDVSVRTGGEKEFPRALSARHRYDLHEVHQG
ncbi:hypothetical protein [Streptomyces sp. 147326]